MKIFLIGLIFFISLSSYASHSCTALLKQVLSENGNEFSSLLSDIKYEDLNLNALFNHDWSIDLSDIPNVNMAKMNRLKLEQRKWAKDILGEKGSIQINNHSKDSTEEIILYNWGRNTQNIENIQKGISKFNAKQIMIQKDPAHLGIYAASDPVSSALFGDIVMKIRLYKPSNSYQLSLDPTSSLGGPMNLPLANFKTGSYLIRDIRGIKRLSFPDKSLILQTWFAKDNNFSLEAYKKFSSQWLLTPNYNAQEKHLIYTYDKQKFFNYLELINNNFDLIPVYEVKRKAFNTTELRLNSIFEAIFNSSQKFVDFDGVINYKLVLDEIYKLNATDLKLLKEFINQAEQSRLTMILDYVIAIGEKEAFKIIDAKETLLNYLERIKDHSKSYIYFKEAVIKKEFKNITSLASKVS